MYMRRRVPLAKKETNVTEPVEEEVAETATETAEEQTIEEKLVAELAAQKEAYLRLAAEYDNFRKRTSKEKEESFSNAKATVFEEFLPVLDNFDRALSATATELEDYKKGVEMTYEQFKNVFQKFDVETFGEAGDKFDPNFHNAVMHVDDDTLDENVIADVLQKGYKIGDKVLRPAMVKVAN